MALSGSVKTNSFDGRYYTLSWSATQSVANNQSTISWTLSCAGGSGWYAERTLYAVIAGKVVANKTARVERYAGTISSGSFTVNHASDGTYEFTASLQAAVFYSSVNCTGSGSFTLNTIPRATTPTLSASSVDMGESVTIKTPRASTAFTHDLAYSFAGGAYVDIATGVATSKTWTVPDLATSIPNAASGTMTIRCITKNGSTTIGTTTVLLTVKVPASVVPTVSAVTPTEVTEGIAAQFGAFIQNKSKVRVTITAAGAKGSTIKSYSTTLQGATYTGNSWTSGLLASSGTLTMTTKVTDSRGRTATKNTTLNVLAYTPPSIAAFSAYRCEADGTEATDGEHVAALYAYSAPSLNGGNTVAMQIQRKPNTGTEWETVYEGTKLSANDMTVLPGFSSDNQWDLRLVVKDWFGASNFYPVLIPTAEVIMDILADGTGVGFGKVAEISNLFDLDWRFRLLGGQMPIVLENNTDLDDLLTPNVYAGKNAASGKYANCPVDSSTFTLEVMPAGDVGQLMQRFTTCSKTNSQVYERFYHATEENGAMGWGAWVNERLAAYPVGAYYISNDNTSPAELFGGTWERIESRFLWAAPATSTLGLTAGERTHTLTIDEMPTHNHLLYTTGGTESRNVITRTWSTAAQNTGTVGAAMDFAGGGAAHNNMPPYVNAAIWRRTA